MVQRNIKLCAPLVKVHDTPFSSHLRHSSHRKIHPHKANTFFSKQSFHIYTPKQEINDILSTQGFLHMLLNQSNKPSLKSPYFLYFYLDPRTPCFTRPSFFPKVPETSDFVARHLQEGSKPLILLIQNFPQASHSSRFWLFFSRSINPKAATPLLTTLFCEIPSTFFTPQNLFLQDFQEETIIKPCLTPLNYIHATARSLEAEDFNPYQWLEINTLDQILDRSSSSTKTPNLFFFFLDRAFISYPFSLLILFYFILSYVLCLLILLYLVFFLVLLLFFLLLQKFSIKKVGVRNTSCEPSRHKASLQTAYEIWYKPCYSLRFQLLNSLWMHIQDLAHQKCTGSEAQKREFLVLVSPDHSHTYTLKHQEKMWAEYTHHLLLTVPENLLFKYSPTQQNTWSCCFPELASTIRPQPTWLICESSSLHMDIFKRKKVVHVEHTQDCQTSTLTSFSKQNPTTLMCGCRCLDCNTVQESQERLVMAHRVPFFSSQKINRIKSRTKPAEKTPLTKKKREEKKRKEKELEKKSENNQKEINHSNTLNCIYCIENAFKKSRGEKMIKRVKVMYLDCDGVRDRDENRESQAKKKNRKKKRIGERERKLTEMNERVVERRFLCTNYIKRSTGQWS
ncbi:hypothetical protein VP01_178g2 [Puccinia sorghi]|uniref:Uncharacterized protein n=1 Tax=Puccinia sorghi TaxID=27349 RepID=A0A0L6VEJ0_9BASI|nr:hypothetical protein VP01_178g2 [Puccinia sorghi]